MRIRRIPPVQQALANQAALLSVDQQESSSRSGKRRRGVTAMEYLVMISFILLIVIITVQKLGGVTSGMLQNSADATNRTNQ